MEDNMRQYNEIEVDLQRLIGALLKKVWLIGVAAVVCAVVFLLATVIFITPTYQSAAMFYVNNNSLSLGETSLSISSSDISASKSLVKSYIVILETRETLVDVIDYAGVDRTPAQVKNMISAAAVDSTEIFKVVVTSEDPKEAKAIADAIAYILPKRISSIIEGTSAKVVDSAVLPSRASAPNYTKNTMLGFLVGLVLVVALIVLRELLDITIRTEDDIAQSCKDPVLAVVPDMNSQSRAGKPYAHSRKGGGKRENAGAELVEVVGKGISFSAAEAYKLLRTKLEFSFVDEGACRVIGVSGALIGEGKSVSAVNLAYSISQLGKRVLLIDCDMRRPSLADKLPIKAVPGLSDYLTGQAKDANLFQPCGLKGDPDAFSMVASGRIPPNPMELLSSAKMEHFIAHLRQEYDYIILDLPPVSEVGDALAVSKLTDGMLVVVRQHHCNRIALNAAVRQLKFVDARILGVIFNCATEDGGRYGSKYYRYYRYYKSGYGKYYSGYNKRRENAEAAEKADNVLSALKKKIGK